MAATTKVHKRKTAEYGILPFILADTPGYREIREFGDMVLDRLDTWDDITKARPVTRVEEAQLAFMLRQFMDMLVDFYMNAGPEMGRRRQNAGGYQDPVILTDIPIEVIARFINR